MSFIEQITQTSFSIEKRWSLILILMITLIIVTPLCGFLFQCGCDWPWLRLDSNCNYYKPHEKHQCPWCASLLTGVFSTGIAILAGIFTTLNTDKISAIDFIKYHSIYEVGLRIIAGLIVFFLIAILTACVAATWQSYPLGVGSYFFMLLS